MISREIKIEKCKDVDIQCMPENGMTLDKIADFYKDIPEDKLDKIFAEYYGDCIPITDKEEFCRRMDLDPAGYSFADIHEFVDEHLQNLNSMEKNIADFKQWLAINKETDHGKNI